MDSTPITPAAPMSLTMTKQNNPLSTKLNKILTSSLDDPETKSALEALSEFYEVNSIHARRNLRGHIENKAMEANHRFLEAFGKVNQQLLTLEEEMSAMLHSVMEMQNRLQLANTKTASILEETDRLRAKSQVASGQKIIIEAFLKRFTLSLSESSILSASATPIGPEFFQALKHLQQIHNDCTALLITEHQRAGLEIMELMALYQDTAYEKLYRWTQLECRAFARDSLEVSESMRDSIEALRQRPVWFQAVLGELVEVRRGAIIRAFIDALTRGGPGGTPRPIELHAHDPLRYVGDMLAWLHQSAAGENEFLEALFNYRRQKSKTRIRKASISEQDNGELDMRDSSEEERILGLLDQILEGTCRPLKTRIEQVLISQPGAITSYRISNLIQFYSITIGKLLGNSVLSLTLQDITDSAFKAFFETLNNQAANYLRFVQVPSADLSPTPALKETTLQLKEIMASYDSSLIVTTNEQVPHKAIDFGVILDAILNPLLDMCEIGARNLSPFEHAIYIINCLHHVQTVLVLYTFTIPRRLVVESQIEANMEVLVKEQYSNLLKHSGLTEIMATIERKDDTPLSHTPNMDSVSLGRSLSSLNSFLISHIDIDSSLSKLSSPRLARIVNERATKLIVEAYAKICNEVRDPANGYDNPSTILPRTEDEVETILIGK